MADYSRILLCILPILEARPPSTPGPRPPRARPLSCYSDLFADVVTKRHIGVQVATAEHVVLVEFSPEHAAFHQIHTVDVWDVPDAAVSTESVIR